METDLFQSCGHCWVFQMCWHIECSTFTASSFRIWNSSTGIPSPPLPLFTVMLSQAHLTSHFRISGSRSVITPLWLSGSWRSFLYSSSVQKRLLVIAKNQESLPCLVLTCVNSILILILQEKWSCTHFSDCSRTIIEIQVCLTLKPMFFPLWISNIINTRLNLTAL